MGRLDGKVAAVTGGASGIGEATVRRFLDEGASVAFCDRDGERGQRVAAELATAGAKVVFTQTDVGTEAACLAFVNGAGQKFGRLDILVNNAGIRKYEKIDEASAASWNEILSVNLMSYVFCAKAAVPLMRRNGGGAIVNVASVRSIAARDDGISCEIVDLRTLLPVDKAMILESFKKTGKALIVHEDNLTMGYGAEVAAILSDEGFEYMDGPIRRFAGPDVPAVPFSHPMQEAFMPNPEKIVRAIRDLAAY